MKQEQNESYEEIFSKLGMIENLYNNEYVTLEEYWKIKNRILDRLIAVKSYYASLKEDINKD